MAAGRGADGAPAPESEGSRTDFRRGIDVSEHNGAVDWDTARPAVDCAILRAGYGRVGADAQFRRNMDECARLGIPAGVYWFSYAYTPELAAGEARACLEAVGDRPLALPAAFDFEYASMEYAAGRGVAVTRALASEMAAAFCAEIRKGGLTPCLYTNRDLLARFFGGSGELLWLAQWPEDPDPADPPVPCAMWQYSGGGSVPGVPGRVDLDAVYLGAEGENGMTQEQFAELMSAWLQAQRALPEPDWSQQEGWWKKLTEQGAVTGGAPEGLVRRDEVAALLGRLGLIR